MKHHLIVKKNTTDRFNLSGVYQLQCKECPSRYIGQADRTFKTRYKERIRDTRYKNNGRNSKFAQNIRDTGNDYDTMENTMKILA
jgi:hypothetical protein